MKKFIVTFSVISFAILSCKKDKDKKAATAPIVTTAAVTNITINSATGGGSIVSDGGAVVTKSGVLWSKTNNTPTFADSVVAGNTANGTFTSSITGLEFSKTYYVRAFAINNVDTAFGSVVTFSTVNDTNKVRFAYNGQEVTYGIIISPTTGKKWLDRNIGAKRAATSFDDYQAYGDLFQWGRPADGHQLINWTSATAGAAVNGRTNVLATTDIPTHSNFIVSSFSPGDWRSDNNSNRWITAPQGPCPAGWHVPRKDEWRAEISINSSGSPSDKGTATSGGITTYNDAYSMLKITLAGRRWGYDDSDAGTVGNSGESSLYWSSSDKTVLGSPTRTDGYVANFVGGSYPGVGGGNQSKSFGLSVRCTKDN